MKTSKCEIPSSNATPISDAELTAILENSPWAKMEREAEELSNQFFSEEAA
jgi:hypothetical protein